MGDLRAHILDYKDLYKPKPELDKEHRIFCEILEKLFDVPVPKTQELH